MVQCYPPAVGGSETVIRRLSEELVRRYGDEVTVFTTNCLNAEGFVRPSVPTLATGWEQRSGVRVRRFAVLRSLAPLLGPIQQAAFRCRLPLNERLRTWYAGPIVPGLARAIRSHEADVVAASSFPLRHMYEALRAARQRSRACVLIGGLHPDDRWGYERPMIHRAIRRADRYIAYTPFEARHVVSRGVPPERVDVVPPGVDPEPFRDAAPEAARRALFRTPGPVVGYIGQLGIRKGIDVLLESMRTVWERHPEVQLLIAGARTEFARTLEERIARLAPAARSHVTLRLDFPESEKPLLYAALDVLAYPSAHESFGLAFLEAWAAAKPVVGCRAGAVSDVIRDERDGLLVPTGDATALATALCRLLERSDWARRLGREGQRRVFEEHRWPTVAARFRESYLRAVASRPEMRGGAA